jgi:molybdopterin-synthase adenylyltransferase
MGGLGCPLALALAGAGAGQLTLVDDDVVDLSNLARQILYRTEDVGRPKALAARDALARRGFARVAPVTARFDENSARALLHDADVVIDGSDNLETKFLVNDASLAAGRPFVIGGALGHLGQILAVRPGESACYRCLFETPPGEQLETCADAGVLGPTCGLVAAWMARAALALASGHDPHRVAGKLWVLPEARGVAIRPRPDCPACGLYEEAHA